MKRIGIFTSGGDSSGMNAHVRAAARSARSHGIEMIGILRGYAGMIEGEFMTLERSDTANIISRGGTILRTSRCPEFHTAEGRAKAAQQVKDAGIEGIIACGGDGTFHGAEALHREHGIPVVGTPGTIDNDLYGTDFTIGYDTAINVAAEAIDKIRETADSHGRVFIVEVMGRHAGFIAMDVGISCGAEYIAVPELQTNMEVIRQRIEAQGKLQRAIIIVGEGDEAGGAVDFSRALKQNFNIDSKVTILGHIQRGGAPTVQDRVLASRLGDAAVTALLNGRTNVMVGETRGEISYTPFTDTWTKKKSLPDYLVRLADILA